MSVNAYTPELTIAHFKFKAGDNLVMKDRGDGFYSGKRQLVERGVER